MAWRITRHLVVGVGVAASCVVTSSLLLATQSTRRVFPASEAVATKYGIHTYQLHVRGTNSDTERHLEATLLDLRGRDLGHIEMTTTRQGERTTIRWKGETISLVVGQERGFELHTRGRKIVSPTAQVTPQAEEFFRQHAEAIAILREVGQELWARASEIKSARKLQGCSQPDPDDGDVSISRAPSCNGPWTWDCSWNVRVFRSWACGDARVNAGESCSNASCWGCCAFAECNCACAVGDFACSCCVDGQMCGQP